MDQEAVGAVCSFLDLLVHLVMSKSIHYKCQNRQDKRQDYVQHTPPFGKAAVSFDSPAATGNAKEMKKTTAVAIANGRPQAGMAVAAADLTGWFVWLFMVLSFFAPDNADFM